MSCLSRRLALSALSLGFALALAASPAQARESPSPGWLGGLAHELAQWATGWWSWPAGGAATAAPGKSHSAPAAARLRGFRPDCGSLIDPNGCPAALHSTPPARSPGRLRVECGSLIDPNGNCI
jgi:hypothetical protein